MVFTVDASLYPSFIAADIAITVRITTTYVTWTSNAGDQSTIAVTLKSVSCNCASLAWTAPSIGTATINVDASGTPSVPAPVSDTSATSSNPAFAACYDSGVNCATTGTYATSSIVQSDGSALPSWIVWN